MLFVWGTFVILAITWQCMFYFFFKYSMVVFHLRPVLVFHLCLTVVMSFVIINIHSGCFAASKYICSALLKASFHLTTY